MNKEKLSSTVWVCPLGSTLTVEGMIIVTCLRFFSSSLVFCRTLWTQGLEGALVGSQVNGLSKNRVVGAVVLIQIWW